MGIWTSSFPGADEESQAAWAGSVAAGGQIRWPRPGRFVTGHGEVLMAAVIIPRHADDSLAGVRGMLCGILYGMVIDAASRGP